VIVSALFLIGLFLSISCYLIMLGINFIGLSYLLVYVGAVKKGGIPEYPHAALVKLQLYKILLIIVNFYVVDYKNNVFSVINKYICKADSTFVNYYAIFSYYFSPLVVYETTLQSFDFFMTPSSPSPSLVSRDVLDRTEDDVNTKPSLQYEEFIS